MSNKIIIWTSMHVLMAALKVAGKAARALDTRRPGHQLKFFPNAATRPAELVDLQVVKE
jgi:hypothetical protein